MGQHVYRGMRVPRDPREVTIELRRPRTARNGPRLLRLSRSARAPHGPALRRLTEAWVRANVAVDVLPRGPARDAFDGQLVAVQALVWRLGRTLHAVPDAVDVDDHLVALAGGLELVAATARHCSVGAAGALGGDTLHRDVHAVLETIAAQAAAHRALR
jgi:hypothetical protein